MVKIPLQPDCDSECQLSSFLVDKIDEIMCDIDNTINSESLTFVDYEAECDAS